MLSITFLLVNESWRPEYSKHQEMPNHQYCNLLKSMPEHVNNHKATLWPPPVAITSCRHFIFLFFSGNVYNLREENKQLRKAHQDIYVQLQDTRVIPQGIIAVFSQISQIQHAKRCKMGHDMQKQFFS